MLYLNRRLNQRWTPIFLIYDNPELSIPNPWIFTDGNAVTLRADIIFIIARVCGVVGACSSIYADFVNVESLAISTLCSWWRRFRTAVNVPSCTRIAGFGGCLRSLLLLVILSVLAFPIISFSPSCSYRPRWFDRHWRHITTCSDDVRVLLCQWLWRVTVRSGLVLQKLNLRFAVEIVPPIAD